VVNLHFPLPNYFIVVGGLATNDLITDDAPIVVGFVDSTTLGYIDVVKSLSIKLLNYTK